MEIKKAKSFVKKNTLVIWWFIGFFIISGAIMGEGIIKSRRSKIIRECVSKGGKLEMVKMLRSNKMICIQKKDTKKTQPLRTELFVVIDRFINL